MSYSYLHLNSSNISLFKDLIKLFADVFEENETYQDHLPSDKYLQRFLSEERHIVLIAQNAEQKVVGGLVAYQLDKFEQERSEIYVYDVAVDNQYQRKGIGTHLFSELKNIAKQRGAYVITVEAHAEDKHAVSFYRTMSSSEIKAHHFDIQV